MTQSLPCDGVRGERNRVPQQADRAARWHRLDQTIVEIRTRFSDLSAVDLQATIDEAVTASRRE